MSPGDFEIPMLEPVELFLDEPGPVSIGPDEPLLEERAPDLSDDGLVHLV